MTIKSFKKIALGLLIALLSVFVLNIILNGWIKNQLPGVINKKNDSSYFITYKNLEVSILKRSILAYNLVIVPKGSLKDTLSKKGVYAKIQSIEIEEINVWNLIFSNKIKATTITIKSPDIIVYDKNDKHSVRNSVVAPFEKIIKVSNVFLSNGNLKLLSKKEEVPILSINNINFNLEGIKITEDILNKKIPLEYENYTISCDSLFYHPNSFYNLSTNKVSITKNAAQVKDFKMIPAFSRNEFISKLTKEKDIYTLLCKSISLKNNNWGFKEDDFFFHCSLMTLDNANANIYRSKEPADDLSKKHLYNKLLRDLKFDLKVDTLKVQNSKLVYEEEKKSEVGAGVLQFNDFNLTATSLNSGFKKEKLSDVKIAIHCKFMNNSPFTVNWSFNVLDKSDGFKIQGKLVNFEAEQINAFTKPYMNVTTKGVLDEVRFNFSGNDLKSTGQFAVQYDDLKFTVYQKDARKKKNKVLSFIANIFVKDDTKEKITETTINVDRNPEKSFYNFLWISIAEGLKKILI